MKDTWQYICQYSELFGVLIPGILFLFVWYQRRDKTHAALALCALSPAVLFFASSYGNESSFRVALFALPWLCAGLARTPDLLRLGYQLAMLAATAVLAVTYLCADLGLADIQVISPGQVVAERMFETAAPQGSELVQFGVGSGPVQLTSHYSEYRFDSFREMRAVTPDQFVQFVLPYLQAGLRHGGRLFVVSSHEGAAYSALDNGVSVDEYGTYVDAVATSREMRTLYHSDGVTYMEYLGSRPR